MEKYTRYEKETMRYKASSFVVVENCTNEYSIYAKRRRFCELFVELVVPSCLRSIMLD